MVPYLVIWGPADPEGLDAGFELGTMQLRSVAPNTPLAVAGLKTGDQVFFVDGQPVQSTNDWAAVLANLQVFECLEPSRLSAFSRPRHMSAG